MLPEGRYRARGTSASAGINKNGKDYVAVAFRIIGGEYEGEVVEDIWYLASEKSTAISIEKLQAAGVSYARGDITDLDGFGCCECEITLKQETTPTGQERLRVMYVGEPGAARGKPLDPGERKGMQSRWASLLLQVRKPPRKADEEIPF